MIEEWSLEENAALGLQRLAPFARGGAIDSRGRAEEAEKIAQRFALIDTTLAKQDYLLGPNASVADVYLFVVARWSNNFDIDLDRWPALAKFMDRMAERASVKAALNAESQARKAA